MSRSPLPIIELKEPFFKVRDLSFYYGWVILIVGTLGMMCAIPGSPPGLSVFIDPMLSDLSMGRDTFSLAYTLGTITAGVVAPFAGNCIERYGVRGVASLAFLALGCILIYTGFIPEIYSFLGASGGSNLLAFMLIYAAFAGMRVAGVAFGMTVCRSMIFQWFASRRNLATTINGVFLSLTFSSAPILLNGIANITGPRFTWIVLGLLFVVVMPLVAFIFFRDSPESCGVAVENDALSGGQNRDLEDLSAPSYCAREVLRSFPFWAITLCIAVHAIVGTGAAFHIVAIGEAAGIERKAALGLFLPIGVINIVTTLSLGWASRKCSVRSLVLVMVGALVLTLGGLFLLEESAGRIAYIVGCGIGWGTFGILISVPWPRFYGRRHLGSINGLVTGATVITSGLGPYLFSMAQTHTGSFGPALVACAWAVPLCLASALAIRNPRRKAAASIRN